MTTVSASVRASRSSSPASDVSPDRARASGGWLDDLIAAHRPGWSLAQPFYNDPAIFARDMDRVFFRHWIYAGHVARIPKPGDYFLHTIADESIIVTRGAGGQVHALFNVCRHRGSRVCLEDAGHAKALVCPYHAWTYGLDGQLRAAPAMPDGFDRETFGLRRCHVRVVEGMIYISLAPPDQTPPNRDSAFRDIESYFQPHRLAEAKIAATMTWHVRANWKLVVENFNECYHCLHTHPEYCSVMAHATPDSTASPKQREAYNELLAAWESRTRAQGYHTGRIDGDVHVLARIPIKDGFVTQSPDGKPIAPLMGDYRQYDGGLTALRIYPMNYAYGLSDHGVIPRFTPLGPQLTEVEFVWLVHPDAVEGVDYDVERLAWVWKVTTDQDKKIVDDNQSGVNSVAYQPGPYSKVEQGLTRFTAWYLAEIS